MQDRLASLAAPTAAATPPCLADDAGPVETPKGEERLRNPHRFWYDGEGQVNCYCYDANRTFADAALKFIYPVRCVTDGQD